MRFGVFGKIVRRSFMFSFEQGQSPFAHILHTKHSRYFFKISFSSFLFTPRTRTTLPTTIIPISGVQTPVYCVFEILCYSGFINSPISCLMVWVKTVIKVVNKPMRRMIIPVFFQIAILDYIQIDFTWSIFLGFLALRFNNFYPKN